MTKVVNEEELYDVLTANTMEFILNDCVDMFENNHLNDYNLDIVPKTSKAFTLYVIDDKDNIVAVKNFTAGDVRGVNGTFKLAEIVSLLGLLDF